MDFIDLFEVQDSWFFGNNHNNNSCTTPTTSSMLSTNLFSSVPPFMDSQFDTLSAPSSALPREPLTPLAFKFDIDPFQVAPSTFLPAAQPQKQQEQQELIRAPFFFPPQPQIIDFSPTEEEAEQETYTSSSEEDGTYEHREEEDDEEEDEMPVVSHQKKRLSEPTTPITPPRSRKNSLDPAVALPLPAGCHAEVIHTGVKLYVRGARKTKLDDIEELKELNSLPYKYCMKLVVPFENESDANYSVRPDELRFDLICLDPDRCQQYMVDQGLVVEKHTRAKTFSDRKEYEYKTFLTSYSHAHNRATFQVQITDTRNGRVLLRSTPLPIFARRNRTAPAKRKKSTSGKETPTKKRKSC